MKGKDRGKQGRVLEANPKAGRILVENVNMIIRHQRPRPIQNSSRMGGPQIIPGGRIEKAAPLPVSNVMVICPTCKKPTRVGTHLRTVKDKTIRVRVCRNADCGQEIDKYGDHRDLHAPRQGSVPERVPSSAKDELGLKSIMQVPRIAKITLNMGVGEAKNDAKQLDQAVEELTTIAGQRAQIRRARKSVAQFKIREGMPIGAKVTLRGDRMYEFLDRLISIALPRIRDFRGLNPRSFDGRGNYSLGVREQIIFPEINYDDIQQVRGLDVTITTTAETDDHARALLLAIGMPFSGEGERRE